jgi:putative SOS response-associated peptidase YedK
MCGRFGLTRPDKLDLKRYGVGNVPALEPRYNVAPGDDILVVRQRQGERVADLVHWGLIPSWAKDEKIGNRMANARADTVLEKGGFKNTIRSRRCLIPADLFYEWQVIPGQRRKRPHLVKLKDGEPFALGGLWEYWKPNDDEEGIVSCTIITTEPNVLVAALHDRMPVIIPPEKYRAWLDPATPMPIVRDLVVQPFPSDEMESYPVTLAVNDAKVDTPEVIEPAQR